MSTISAGMNLGRVPCRLRFFASCAVRIALVGYLCSGCSSTELDLLHSAAPHLDTQPVVASVDAGAVPPSPSQATSSLPPPAPTLPPVMSSAVPTLDADAGAAGCAVQDAVTAPVHRLSLRSNGGCLRATADQVPFAQATHGYALDLALPCVEDASTEFELVSMLSGVFQIVSTFLTTRNVPNQVLDVMKGEALPGTQVILYGPNGLQNQHFHFISRGGGFFSVAPEHAPNLCLEYSAGQIWVQLCVADSSAQQWQFLPLGCSVDAN